MQAPIATVPAWPARKVGIPIVNTLTRRSRLFGPLKEAAEAGQVVLIVSPGGSGKTSLVADWARSAPVPVAWYSLDVADRDSRRLLSGILVAVERVLPGTTTEADRMLRHGAAEAAVMDMLLCALEEHPLTLVLDDFQHIDKAPDIAPLWEHFFRFRPPTLSLMILSRTVPLLGFTRLSAAGALLGLGLSDLSFSEDEAAQLLAAHGLDASAGPMLARRSDGWAAGMLLMARAGHGAMRHLRVRPDQLMEQLGGEMLARLTADERHFLLESAALGPVTPEEADGILDRRDSAGRFADLAFRGFFLNRREEIYRYHDLFAEYLTGVLFTEDPDRLHMVRRRAAGWWEAHGDVPRALALLADDKDWAILAAALERSRGHLWTRRLWGTIIEFTEQLPPERRTILVLELCGYAYLDRGRFADALEMADAGVALAKTDEEWLRARLLATQVLILSGRYEEGIRSADSALPLAVRIGHETIRSRLQQWRGRARLSLGLLAEGRADLTAALALHQERGDLEGEARTLAQLAMQLTQAGQVADIEDLLTRAGALWRRQGHTIALANVHDCWARLHALRGDLVQARAEACRSLELLKNEVHRLSECEATVTLAEICLDAGDVDEAGRCADEALKLAARLDAADLVNAAQRMRIAVALARRDRTAARRLIDEARTFAVTPVDGALLDYYEGVHALRARAFGRAVDRLAEAVKHLEAMHRQHYAARALLLLAEAALGLGAQQRAESALNRMATMVAALGCEGFLQAPARMARQVLGDRHLLRGLRKRTHLLLDRLAADVPALTVVRAIADESETRQADQVLHISPFGQGRIALANRPIKASALPPKARELLFYAARASRPIPRAELLNTIWQGDERAAQNLWDASRHLRRLLGEETWTTLRGRYQLAIAIRHDGHEFEQCAAAALGKGPRDERMTAGERAMALVGAGGYLEWCDSLWAGAERARTMTRAMHVALALGACYAEVGRRDDALAAYRRAVAFEPYEEAPRLALLRALVEMGRVDEATREYNAYRRLLRDELGAKPSDDLRAVVARRTART